MAEVLAPVAEHKPYVPDEARVAEFTPKAIAVGALFGLIFGASTVYLALKAGLTVSASIPIAVLSISLLKKLGGSTILENNIVQTIGSAGESIAAGVVFTLPGFLFLAVDPSTRQSVGAGYFSYWTIFTLALLGGMLGVLMMVPLRRALIVKEHANLPYPEGTACAQVLIAGEKGGEMARTAYLGLGFAIAYAVLQQILHVIAEVPGYVTRASSRIFPAATVNASITPEYMGVGYIIGPRIAGVLVSGGVLAWLGIIPLIASLVPTVTIATQLVKLGYLADLARPGSYGWDPATQTFAQLNRAVYFAYVRQIGAGAVAAGGFITLLKTLPTIVSSFKESLASLRGGAGTASARRTEQDLSLGVTVFGSLGLIGIMAALPFLPGTFFADRRPDRDQLEPRLGNDHRHPDGDLPALPRAGLDRRLLPADGPLRGRHGLHRGRQRGGHLAGSEDRISGRLHAQVPAARPFDRGHRRGGGDRVHDPGARQAHPGRGDGPGAAPDRIRGLPRPPRDADGDADPRPALAEPGLAVRAGRSLPRRHHRAVRGLSLELRGRRVPPALHHPADLRGRRDQGNR